MLLIMRRASLAQGLMAKVRDAPGIHLCYEPDYANADVAIRSHLASGALLEVSEDGDHGIDFCLALCAWLREVTPHCRLMLMCPEGQPEAVSRAIEAKRRGEIDDFVCNPFEIGKDHFEMGVCRRGHLGGEQGHHWRDRQWPVRFG